MVRGRLTHNRWVKGKHIENEVVRMLGGEIVALQHIRWEIFQVEGGDQACTAVHRSGNHILVVWIR